jgi:hypothetical protein
MLQTVTLKISEDVLRRAQEYAKHTQRPVEDVLAEWLDRASSDVPVEFLPDDEVLALSYMMMDESQQEELSDLLNRNSEGLLDDDGKERLEDLMAIYDQALLRKSEAIAEAVKRGLRPPLG